MRKLAILILLALGIAVLACGHSNRALPIETTTNGYWEAQLIGGVGDASQLNFVTNFSVTNTNGGSTEQLSIPSFEFINIQPCFLTQTPTGTADLTTNTENQVTGNVSYTIQSTNPGGNKLSLFTQNPSGVSVGGVSGTTNGATYTTLTNGIIWGEWTLTSTDSTSSCTGQGTFVMCQGAATCTIP
jgi:hypothetical protein